MVSKAPRRFWGGSGLETPGLDCQLLVAKNHATGSLPPTPRPVFNQYLVMGQLAAVGPVLKDCDTGIVWISPLQPLFFPKLNMNLIVCDQVNQSSDTN